MSEMLEALLWCAALATWLMIAFTIAREGVRKIVQTIRSMSAQGKVHRSLARDAQSSRETRRPE